MVSAGDADEDGDRGEASQGLHAAAFQDEAIGNEQDVAEDQTAGLHELLQCL